MHPLKEGGVIDEGAAIKDVGAAPEVVYLPISIMPGMVNYPYPCYYWGPSN